LQSNYNNNKKSCQEENTQKMKKTKEYVNNADLYEVLIEFNEDKNENKRMPEYIGYAIKKICTELTNHRWFIGYTNAWKEEMISDAIVDCVAAVGNFDPSKTKNPFGYFTQIAWYAFRRRIDKERRQTYTKHKNFENSSMHTELADEFGAAGYKGNEFSNEIIRSFEQTLLTKKEKSSKMIDNKENVELIKRKE